MHKKFPTRDAAEAFLASKSATSSPAAKATTSTGSASSPQQFLAPPPAISHVHHGAKGRKRAPVRSLEEISEQAAKRARVASAPAAASRLPEGFQAVYTDGSAVGSPHARHAGYGVYFGEGDPRNMAGGVGGLQTCNRGELMVCRSV